MCQSPLACHGYLQRGCLLGLTFEHAVDDHKKYKLKKLSETNDTVIISKEEVRTLLDSAYMTAAAALLGLRTFLSMKQCFAPTAK